VRRCGGALPAQHNRSIRRSNPLLPATAHCAVMRRRKRRMPSTDLARPALRLFTTYGRWSETARIAGIDSARIYVDNYTTFLSGWTFGLQGEAWW